MGSEQLDRLQNITGEWGSVHGQDWVAPLYQTAAPTVGLVSGAFKVGDAVPGNQYTIQNSSGKYQTNKLGFDASLVARTGTETTGKNRASLPLVKVS